MINFVEQSEQFHDSWMLEVVEYCDLVLENARLGLEVFEASFVDHFNCHLLFSCLADSAVDLAELTRAQLILRIYYIFIFQILNKPKLIC